MLSCNSAYRNLCLKWRAGPLARQLLLCAVCWLGAGQWAAAGTAPDVITFFCGSDLHYGGATATNSCADISRKVLDNMNALPGQPWPTNAGSGVVDQPRGVLLLGDLTEGGRLSEWIAFTNNWGLLGEQRLLFPVYEGFGNHDLATGLVPEAVKVRNRYRLGLTSISMNGYHYSWDWDFLHLVCLNLFPGNEPATNYPALDPKGSLEFLVGDLARNVGQSGRPVILCHHYGLDGQSNRYWWTEEQRTKYLAAIKNYNVILILVGHTHTINGAPLGGFDSINDGTIGKFLGDFLVTRVSRTNLVVLERTLTNSWNVLAIKPIRCPPPKPG